MEIDRIIERSIRESHAIDVEALCIIAGVKVWVDRLASIHDIRGTGEARVPPPHMPRLKAL